MTQKTYSDYIMDYEEYGGFDVHLVVQQKHILTHRLILSAGSNFLKSLIKGVELYDEPVTMILPDISTAEVDHLVNILYNKTSLNPEGSVHQIFTMLGFNDVQPMSLVRDADDPDKSEIKMMLDDAIKEEIMNDESECADSGVMLDSAVTDENFYFDIKELPVTKKKRGRKKIDPATLPKEYRCNDCDYVGKCKTYLQRHRDRTHTDLWFYCQYKDCDNKYRTSYYLTAHITKDHKGRLFFCDKCSYKSKFNDLLKLHIMKHHEGVKFICDQCGHEAANPKSLGYHIKQVHEGLFYPCSECDFTGVTYSSFMHHMNRQHKPKQFLCDQCSFSSGDRGGLNTHVKRVHTEKAYTCHLCDFTTKLKWSLKRHQDSKHKRELETIVENMSKIPNP